VGNLDKSIDDNCKQRIRKQTLMATANIPCHQRPCVAAAHVSVSLAIKDDIRVSHLCDRFQPKERRVNHGEQGEQTQVPSCNRVKAQAIGRMKVIETRESTADRSPLQKHFRVNTRKLQKFCTNPDHSHSGIDVRNSAEATTRTGKIRRSAITQCDN